MLGASAMYSGNPFCCDKKYMTDGEKVMLDRGASGAVSGAVTGAVTGAVKGGLTGGPAGAFAGASAGAVAGWSGGMAKGWCESSGNECVIC